MVPIELVYVLVAIIIVLLLALATLAWRLDRTITVEAMYGLIDFAEQLAEKSKTPADDIGVRTARRIADAVKAMEEQEP